MRRPTTVELMLLTTVLLWALNLSVTRYILTHGFQPLPYATVRYGLAALIFVGLTLFAERTLRVERRHLPPDVLEARLRAELESVLDRARLAELFEGQNP